MVEVKKRACLVVIDGWGISPNESTEGDAIRNASTPVMTSLEKTEQFMPIAAHGLAVGLPDGLMGNSEVGHLNIGSGRVVYQDIVRIELAIKQKTLASNNVLVNAMQRAKDGNGRLHFLGLISDGGVHAHINHLFAFLEAAKAFGVPQTFIHFFADGRDTAPTSTVKYLKQLLEKLEELKYGKLATITGRYYAMDRDKRWERIQIAYEGLTLGKGESTTDPVATVESRYAAGETDEFLKPIIVDSEGCIQDNDTMVFINFRSDRMRQIAQTFGKVGGVFPFTVPVERQNLFIATMTQYKADFPFPVLFAPQTMKNTLAEWISSFGLSQRHIAETEKYAHVTFFFNGGTETQFTKEVRDLVPSPKVATYDLKPEMSAHEVGKVVANAIRSSSEPLVICNFAPPDMVGHTGIYEAAIKGVEATDQAIGEIWKACQETGCVLFVTADHGNAEKMKDENGNPFTAHTTAPVPFIMAGAGEMKFKHADVVDAESGQPRQAALCDVAPTVLEAMGLEIPSEMTGKSLIA